MPMIVTRQQAMDHLRIDDATDEADDLDLKIAAASAVVLEYIEKTAADYADDTSSDSSSDSDSDSGSDSGSSTTYTWPYQLQVAVLLLVGDMHRFRDSSASNKSGLPIYTKANLPSFVRALIYPQKSWGLDD